MRPDITFHDGVSKCGCKIVYVHGRHAGVGHDTHRIFFCRQHIKGRIKVMESHSRCKQKFSLCLDCADHNYCERYSKHREEHDKKQATKKKHEHYLRVVAMSSKEDPLPSLRF